VPLLTNRVGALKARFSLFLLFFRWANGGGCSPLTPGCAGNPGITAICSQAVSSC